MKMETESSDRKSSSSSSATVVSSMEATMDTSSDTASSSSSSSTSSVASSSAQTTSQADFRRLSRSSSGAREAVHTPTKGELQDWEATMLDVKNNVIPNRRQKARGRLTKDETARVQYITGVGLANVHLGKLPSPEDQRALLLPALHEVKQVGGKTVSKLSKEEKVFITGWAKKVHEDPRSSSSTFYSPEVQKSILDFMAQENSAPMRRYVRLAVLLCLSVPLLTLLNLRGQASKEGGSAFFPFHGSFLQ